MVDFEEKFISYLESIDGISDRVLQVSSEIDKGLTDLVNFTTLVRDGKATEAQIAGYSEDDVDIVFDQFDDFFDQAMQVIKNLQDVADELYDLESY